MYLTNKDKLDEDFNKFNKDIERATEMELSRIRGDINALKEKATKLSETMSRPISNEQKRS